MGKAAKNKTKRVITSGGTATIKVKPDSARVFFGVETIAATVKEARADNARQVKKLMDALKGLKLPNLKMKSADIEVDVLRSERNNSKLPRIVGFHVTNTFTALVESKDPAKLSAAAGLVLDTVLENGANQVDRIAIFKKDLAEVHQQALTLAVADGLANIKALAKGAGVKADKPLTIHGEPEYGYYLPAGLTNAVQSAAPSGAQNSTTVVAGDLTVTCRVSVSCSF